MGEIENVAITDALIHKMQGITTDIKIYMNLNIQLAKHQKSHPVMDKTDVDEIIRIRASLKGIIRRMEEKNSFSMRARNKSKEMTTLNKKD